MRERSVIVVKDDTLPVASGWCVVVAACLPLALRVDFSTSETSAPLEDKVFITDEL